MARREFPTKVKVAVIKRATREHVVYCELCGLPARKFQIDHRVADSHGGEPTLANAQLICDACYSVKNAADATVAAKLKRIEARHLGADRTAKKIQSAGFPKREKIRRGVDKSILPPLPHRGLYRDN